MTINDKVLRKLRSMKKDEGVRVPHKALALARLMGRDIRRMCDSNEEAAELCIDLADKVSV